MLFIETGETESDDMEAARHLDLLPGMLHVMQLLHQWILNHVPTDKLLSMHVPDVLRAQ